MTFAPFARDQRGSSAAEFALVLPIFILFLLGLIDIGRYVWAINEAQKATQIGARWAVVTDMIPTGLAEYSYAIDGGIPQGEPVPVTAFPGVHCDSSGGVVSCSCAPGGTCASEITDVEDAGQENFQALVTRMHAVYPRLSADDVEIDYDPSGPTVNLGFSGDPNGPDVSPLVTVRLQNQAFPLFFILGNTVPLPTFSYSLTMEDAAGTIANF